MVSCYHFVSAVIGTFGRIIIVIIIIIIIIYYYQVPASRHHRDQHRRMRFRACSFFHFFCRSNGNRLEQIFVQLLGHFCIAQFIYKTLRLTSGFVISGKKRYPWNYREQKKTERN